MGDRRSQIIDAAAALMARQGFQQTSVDDVIREARLCGKGHFYHHFRSKEELGFAVLERQFERFSGCALAGLRQPVGEPLERLERFVDAVVAVQSERGCAGATPCGTLAAEMAQAHEGYRCRVQQLFDRWTAEMERLLEEARPSLDGAVDPPRLARFIVATLEGALLMTRVHQERAVLQGIALELKRFIAMHGRGGGSLAGGAGAAWGQRVSDDAARAGARDGAPDVTATRGGGEPWEQSS